MKILLVTTPFHGLILTADLPREATRSLDPKTGELKPRETRSILTFRDLDLDGVPDEFKVEPRGELLYEEELTDDGFVKFRNSSEHQSILTLWSVSIGFSINHFLHGIDSALPR